MQAGSGEGGGGGSGGGGGGAPQRKAKKPASAVKAQELRKESAAPRKRPRSEELHGRSLEPAAGSGSTTVASVVAPSYKRARNDGLEPRTIFVKNLAFRSTEEDVRAFFEQVGVQRVVALSELRGCVVRYGGRSTLPMWPERCSAWAGIR